MIRTRVRQGKAFRALIGVYPHGTDQSSSNVFDQPALLRETTTIGVIQEDSHHYNKSGDMGLVGGVLTSVSGVITVADNGFNAWVDVHLGDYCLQAGSDFQIGLLDTDTAINLAAVINTLSGFSATANMADVIVLFSGSTASDVEFRAVHYGAVVNLTFAPTDGLMLKGSPQVVAPTVT